MYEQEIKRTERPMHYRFLSMLLAFAIALSSVVVGITPLKAKAAGADSTPYQFKDGSFVQYTGTAAEVAAMNSYVNEQKNNIYSYYAAYKVPKLSDSILVLGNDLFSVYTYVDGNADNGTGVKNRGYFFSDTDINVIGNIQAPFDGSASIDTSVWHKQALDFSTSVLAGYSTHEDDDPFKNFVDAVNVERTGTGALVRYNGKNGQELRGFFPDNIYVEWTDSINWDLYDIQFALRDFLTGSSFDYFENSENSAVKNSCDENGIVWIDNTVGIKGADGKDYHQTAASKPKNVYIPTKNSAFKANNSALADNVNESNEDIHPFLYLCTETLPSLVDIDNSGETIENWFKGVDQYGVNFSSANLSYSVSGNAGNLVTINPSTGVITLGSIPENIEKTAIITVTAKTANSQYPVQTISFPITVGSLVTYSNASRYTTWDSELDTDSNFYNAQFQSGSTAISGQTNYDISIDIPTSLPITFVPVDYNSRDEKIMKALNTNGGTNGGTKKYYTIDETAIGDDKSKIDLSKVILPSTSSSNTPKKAWDKISANKKMGITLICTINDPVNMLADPTATDAGGFLKSSTLESGGTNGQSGYTLQLAKDLTEGWYAIYENRDSKPSYHIFYLAADSTSPIYNSQGEKIAVLANTTLNIKSGNYETEQLHYFRPKQSATIKINGYSYNANGETFGETSKVENTIVNGRNLEVKKYTPSVSFFPENIYFNWAATNIKTLPKTQTGIYKITIGGSFSSDDFITINGVRFAGNSKTSTIASNIYGGRANLTGYDVTYSSSTVTLTEKTNGVGIPEIFVYSKSGTVTLTVTQLGAAYDTAFKIKTATNYYKDYVAKDADNNLKSFYVTDGSNNYVISDSAIEKASVFDNITLGSYTALNKNFDPNVEGKKVDYFPFLYKYSLTGSLFDSQPATIDSGLVDIADGVITNFKPSVIKGSISKDVEKEIGFTGIDQYGVYYQALKYDLVDTNTKADISAPSGVLFNAGKLTVNNSLLANPVTDLTVKITALTRNDDSVEGNTDKTTVIYIPLRIYKEYSITYDKDDGEFPEGYTPPVDTFTAESTHTYSEFISNVTEPTKDGALFMGWYDVDKPDEIITADTPITNENHVLKPLWNYNNYTIKYLYPDGTTIKDKSGSVVNNPRTVLPNHPILSDAVTSYEVYNQATNRANKRGRFIGWRLGDPDGLLISPASSVNLTDSIYYLTATKTADEADGTVDYVIYVYADFEKEYEFDFYDAKGNVKKLFISESELDYNIYANYFTDTITLGEVEDIYKTNISYENADKSLLPDGFICMFNGDTPPVHPWAIRTSEENPKYTDSTTGITVYPAENYIALNGYLTSSDISLVDDTEHPYMENGVKKYPKKQVVTDSKTTFKDVAIAYINNSTTGTKTMGDISAYDVINVYEAIERAYKLTYNANTGNFGMKEDGETPITSVDYKVGVGNAVGSSKPANPSRDGYKFTGWYTDDSCTTSSKVDFTKFVMPAEDEILYAGWAEVLEVTFDPNGGNFDTGVITTIEETYGEKYEFPSANPSRNNYAFDGWYTEKDGGTKIDSNSIVNVKEDTTVYAHWKPAEYTISYNLNEGSLGEGVTNPTTYNYDSDAFTLNNPTKKGYTFIGWTGTDLSGNNLTVTVPKNSKGNRFYVANWSKNSYTISYELNGGTVATENPTSYDVESSDITLVNPTKDGYTFTGWTGSNGSTPNDNVTITSGSTGNRTYTANWTPNNYEVRFIYNDGVTTSTTKSVTYTEPYGELPIPTRFGYIFKGWYADSEFKTSEVKADTIYNIKDNSNLYAKWDKVSILINFDKNGAPAQTEMDPQTFLYAVADNLYANTYTREGYDFVGWSKVNTATDKDYADKASFTFAPDNQTDLDTAIANGITLYAVWDAIDYTISYDLKGGTNASTNPATYTIEDTPVTIANPTRNGYVFVGWTYEGQTAPTKTASIPEGSTGDKVFTAVWVEECTVTLDKNGGQLPTGTEETITTTVGTSVDLPDASKNGYTFDGWYDGDTKVDDPYTVEKDVTLKAKYTPNEYALTIYYQYVGGATAKPTHTENVKFNDTYSVTSPTIDNFTPDTPIVTGTMDSTSGKIVTVTYTENAKHTATFNVNGGTGTISPISQYEGLFITIPDGPSKTGYDFAGWKLGENIVNAGNSYKMGTTDVEFVAQWTPIEYKINYVLGEGGINATSNPATYTIADTPINIANPTRDGYEFVKWTEGNTIAAGSTGDKTFTAEWAKIYTVTLNPDIGSLPAGTSNTIVATDGSSVDLPDASKDGYSFDGWYDGDTKVDDPYTVEKDVTLKAKYKPISYGITYDLDGGSIVSGNENPSTYTIESADFTLNNPSKTGYTFAGWTGTGLSGETINVTVAQGSTGARSYVANWTPIQIPVTFDPGTGATVDPGSKDVTYDKPYGDLPIPEKPGYEFTGWVTESGDPVDEDTIVDFIEPQTLYAGWKDTTPPTGTVKVDDKTWDELVDPITYDIIKSKPVEVTLTAEDNDSPDVTIEYIVSATEVDPSTVTDWTEYDGPFTIPADVDGTRYIVYVKLTDDTGNVTYISSNGHEVYLEGTKHAYVTEENNPGLKSVEGLEELFGNERLYTEDDKKVVDEGGRVTIETLVIKEEKDTIAKRDVPIVEAQIENKDYLIIAYYDIQVIKRVYSYNPSTELYTLIDEQSFKDIRDDKITYTFDIPKDALGKDEYYCFRVHDGVSELIATAPKGSTTISISADKFSTYVLAYKEPEEIVNTRDESPVVSMSLLSGLSALMFVAIKHKKDELEED